MFLTIMLTAVAVSLDSVVAGFSYGVSKIKIPKKSLAVLSVIPVIMTFLVMLFASFFIEFLSDMFIKIFGFITMMSLAVFSLTQYINSRKPTKNSEKHKVSEVFINPNLADTDGTNDISFKESIVLGFAIGVDACTASVALAFCEANIMLTAFSIGILNFAFLEIGNICGKIVKIRAEFIRLFSVVIFIFLAFLKLI